MVYISEKQLAVHKTTEFISILFIAPLSIWMATRKHLDWRIRLMFGMFGVGALIVDGGLLLKWKKKEATDSEKSGTS